MRQYSEWIKIAACLHVINYPKKNSTIWSSNTATPHVEQTWQVTYSESGMTQLLHRLGYVYKKPKLVPGKADAGRQRLNINGVIDGVSLHLIVRYDVTINAQSTVALFKQIEPQHPYAQRIHLICDNARYYRSQVVAEYLLDSKIELIFLPLCPQPELDRALLAVLQEEDFIWQVL